MEKKSKRAGNLILIKIKSWNLRSGDSGETMSSSDIVDEFAYSHQTWAVEFLEGWQVITKLHFL